MASQRDVRRRRGRKPAATGRDELPAAPVPLQRILAAAGFGSRRGVEEFLRQGRVTVNGRVVKLGDSADPSRDLVKLDGERLPRQVLSYWMVHKPSGVLSTVRDDQGRRTIVELLPRDLPRLYPVGRLDRDTSGLVLLTNDGPLAHVLLHPSMGNEREYHVRAKGEVLEKTRRRLARGIRLDDRPTAPASVGSIRYDPATDTSEFALTLTEGRKRQIRRTLLVLGHPVKKLVRVRVGPQRLGRLKAGAARPLREDEVRALRAHAAALAEANRSADVISRRPGAAAARRRSTSRR
jgi:23S rRNA pseudouridine2605 synthase